MFVASSSDDSVSCLNLQDGELQWRFWTDGPVRVTPTIADGKVYFGSDDGHAYCVAVADGRLVWKFRPLDDKRMIVHNGRMIASAPCRTGVVVLNGKAYCGFAMLPWNAAYFCAVDAATGSAEGEGCFIQRIDGSTVEGAMAVDGDTLIVPQGRVAPTAIRAADGKRIGSLPGGGGSFAMVAAGKLFHGPGNKTGWINVTDPKTRKPVATHKGFNRCVVGTELEFRLSDDDVSAYNAGGELIWKTPVLNAFELVLNRETLFVGARAIGWLRCRRQPASDSAAGRSMAMHIWWLLPIDRCWSAPTRG